MRCAKFTGLVGINYAYQKIMVVWVLNIWIGSTLLSLANRIGTDSLFYKVFKAKYFLNCSPTAQFWMRGLKRMDHMLGIAF